MEIAIWAGIIQDSEAKGQQVEDSKPMQTWQPLKSLFRVLYELLNPPARDMRGAQILYNALRYLEDYGQGGNMEYVRARNILLYALYRVEAGL